MKPMLAKKWVDYRSRITYPQYVQPKLNGVRGLFSSGIFQSRDEHLWKRSVVDHLVRELNLACPPHFILDGELYRHGLSLQQINGAISVNRSEPTSLTRTIEYHVFDLVSTRDLHLPFSARAELLQELQAHLVRTSAQNIKIVPTTFCPDPALAEDLYVRYRSSRYEGLMYRNPSASYGFTEECTNKENRWDVLLKRKDWIDEEFEILSLEETTGDKGFRGFNLTCLLSNGATFSVGSGLASSELDHYLLNSPRGKQVKVRFECYSDTGIPLKPTIEAILE